MKTNPYQVFRERGNMLVRLGIKGQESRKPEFFRMLKADLANDNPRRQDQLVDEFRALAFGW
jgi:hypothetical protein